MQTEKIRSSLRILPSFFKEGILGGYMKIKNWSEFQHFKDRTPPWIKLYRHLLDDPEWHELSGDEAKTLIMLWLIASEDKNMKGNLPSLKNTAFRLRTTEVKLNQILNKLNGWLIVDDTEVISEVYQVDAPETETETKKRQRETTIPVDFYMTDKVIDWAQKNGYSNLQKHFDNFVLSSIARNYKYTNWDAAFMKAIRDNWAKVPDEKKNKVVL